MDQETRTHLSAQLVKLGDMMGDGLHLEPGGKWIARDYQRVAKALGLAVGPRRRNNSAAINEKMVDRVKEITCQRCSGALKQIRSGSMRAQCVQCGAKFQLLKMTRTTTKQKATV